MKLLDEFDKSMLRSGFVIITIIGYGILFLIFIICLVFYLHKNGIFP